MARILSGLLFWGTGLDVGGHSFASADGWKGSLVLSRYWQNGRVSCHSVDAYRDGKLTEADARWGEFRVMVTNADGTTTAKTLAELDITEINLRPDVTRITLPDGSQITGQTTFTMNGEEHTAANTTLVSEAQGYRVVEVVQVAGGKTTTTQTAYDAAGEVAYIITREVEGGWNKLESLNTLAC